MGLFSKLWRRKADNLPRYVLRLSVRGPTGEMRHQFVTFEAKSREAATEHARRRAAHQRTIRWKLFDAEKREIESGFGAHKATAPPLNDSTDAIDAGDDYSPWTGYIEPGSANLEKN